MWSADSAIQVPFECGLDAGAGAVEQHPLIALGDIERPADLLGTAAGDVSHRDHHALRSRKLLDGPHDDIERLAAEQRVVRKRGPVAGIRPPVAREGAALITKPLCLDCGLVVLFARERREWNAPRLALAPADRDVGDDSHDPRLQRRPPLEPIEALQNPTHASCTTSSALARVRTYPRATASIMVTY